MTNKELKKQFSNETGIDTVTPGVSSIFHKQYIDWLENKVLKSDFIGKVEEFHLTFGHPVKNSPSFPNEKRQKLRVDLIQEELNELQEALKLKDKVEVLDALADLQYVLSGAILEFGMKDIFLDAFNEVHRSNMSKACKDISEAIRTVRNYEFNGIEVEYENKNNVFVITRKSDNKVLKSINYSKAELDKLIDSK